MRWKVALFVAAGWLATSLAQADVRPHALCTEGMVLQQNAKVKIWGTADAGEKVTVTFRDQSESATTDKDGNWLVTLDSGKAAGPLPMTIEGNNKIAYKDVLVGEVWVASGQSNMDWTVSACDKTDKDYATSAKPNPKLRMFIVGRAPEFKPVDNVQGRWVSADPKSVLGFSAVGYFFGRDLQKSLKLPVGIIKTAWGGTRAEAWTSGPVLGKHPLYKDEYANHVKSMSKQKDGKVKNPNAPAALYNGMIHPILNYTIKGAIWYQGESNAGRAYHYRTLFPLMITNWRQDWKQGDFPFYFVQLAPYLQVRGQPGDSNWAELRESQLLTLKLPNTGMAVITDFGNEYDIHPTPKRPVGERLALIARARDYDQKIEFTGPVYEGVKFKGNQAIVRFSHTGKKLVAMELEPTAKRDGKRPGAAWRVKPGSEGAKVTGFTIAGADHKFHNASAKIVGDTVVVSSDEVPNPVAVRYGWDQHPLVNLFNSDGLPASPFRTDTFAVSTQPRK